MTRDVLLKLAILSVLDKSNTIFSKMRNYMANLQSDELLIGLECLEREIIPTRSTFEIEQYLSSLSYEDGRKIKRKFRKIHRRIRKQLEASGKLRNLDNVMGKRLETPDRFQKSSRKYLVFKSIVEELNDKRFL